LADFGQLTITNKGLTLLGKVQAGTPLQFTRLAIGDGSLGSTDPVTLNALIHRLQWVPINAIVREGSNVTVSGAFNNQGAVSPFYYREVGLFAQDPQDGEILYAYANAGTTADEIPAQGSQVIERAISITIVLSTELTLTVELASGVYLPASSYTAADVLAKLLTVHGPGSGINADMVDGLHAKSNAEADAHVVATQSDGTARVLKLRVGTAGTTIPAIYISDAFPPGAPENSLLLKPKTSS